MSDPIYDKKEQLQKIEAGLLPGEEIEAVYDLKGAGTGFIGITSRRLIFHDKTFMRKMKAVVSVPYNRIISLAAEDESGLFTGRGFFASSRIYVMTSHETYEFEFRGAEKAHAAHALIAAHLCPE